MSQHPDSESHQKGSAPQIDPSNWNMYYQQISYMYPWTQYYNYQFYSQYITQSQTALNQPLPPGVTTACKSLYIGNLAEKVSEPLLYDIFSTVGPVESCKLIKDKMSGESAGYGFIDYYDHRTAALALQSFNGRLIYGVDMKVNWAFANQKEDTSTHHHIFVGDIGPEVDDKSLFTAFQPFGSLSDARVMIDPATGRSRGFGFVAFKKKEDAQKALMEMNGNRIGTRVIRCNWANQKGPEMEISAPPIPTAGPDLPTVLAQTPITITTVYVGNVTTDIPEHVLRSAFAEYGQLEEMKVQPGFAFVRYKNHEQAGKAIVGISGRAVGGRILKCSWGKERILTPVLPPLITPKIQ